MLPAHVACRVVSGGLPAASDDMMFPLYTLKSICEALMSNIWRRISDNRAHWGCCCQGLMFMTWRGTLTLGFNCCVCDQLSVGSVDATLVQIEILSLTIQ